MNHAKQLHLNNIRANTAYPVYRGFINTVATLIYILAGFYGLAALIAGLTRISQSFVMGVVIIIGGGLLALMVYLMARLFKEAALIVADIGDVAIESTVQTGLGATK